MEYVARFEMGEITGQTEQERKEQAQPNPESSVDKKGIDTKTVGKVLTIATTATAMSSQIYQQVQSRNNAIRGDIIAQAHLDNQMAYLNEGLKVGGALGIAAITNPALLPAVAVGLAVSYGFRAFSVSQQNQVKLANWQKEAIVNNEKQRRLVQNFTGVRV